MNVVSNSRYLFNIAANVGDCDNFTVTPENTLYGKVNTPHTHEIYKIQYRLKAARAKLRQDVLETGYFF